jgi:putative alpha-1,2-mannosidase
LNLPNGKRFEISAAHNSADHPYIQSARLNGKPLTAPLITYEQIEAGGKLEFVMGVAPSDWAVAWKP